MARSYSLYGPERTSVRAGEGDPDLRVFKLEVFVRDQQRSLDFFVEKLGFDLVADAKFDGENRWVAVAPPNGSTILSLVELKPESAEYAAIGQETHIAFMTEDIYATYERWNAAGVIFDNPPKQVVWRGVFVRFQDVDGNWFELVASDDITRDIETQRQRAAEKLEAERRSAQELVIAKEVQAQLFPQTRPEMRTLDYAGMCIQAREVGGDYYDFLALGQDEEGNGRLALVMGDVSGKGIAAALLMANLQANVRSQTTMAVDHPECMLSSVNELFYANSTAGSYATLFFAEYDESGYGENKSVLRYANCGHLPGLLLRADGSVLRLEATGRPLGIFGAWDCVMRECDLLAGDTLVLYTDGVTESFDASEEEFGEERLIAAMRRHTQCDAQTQMEAIVDEVRRFSVQDQFDDITLIVAKFADKSGA